MIYIALLCIAIRVNRSDLKMLALTLTIGASIFVPLPTQVIANIWYAQCVLGELIVIIIAISLATTASQIIIGFCVALIVMHSIGIIIGPQPGFGPYRIGVPLLECGELAACIVLSIPSLAFIARVANMRTEN